MAHKLITINNHNIHILRTGTSDLQSCDHEMWLLYSVLGHWIWMGTSLCYTRNLMRWKIWGCTFSNEILAACLTLQNTTKVCINLKSRSTTCTGNVRGQRWMCDNETKNMIFWHITMETTPRWTECSFNLCYLTELNIFQQFDQCLPRLGVRANIGKVLGIDTNTSVTRILLHGSHFFNFLMWSTG